MSALILIVEDEPQLAEVLEAYARQEGYRTERAADGNAALTAYRAASPDLILLDVMLPGRSGLDVLKTVRAEGGTPVILVTARAEETDQIVGLELGADDYVVKPFRPREVMARVKAVLRRATALLDDADRPLRVGPLEVDRRAVVARVHGETLSLTPAEFRLLSQLAEAPGRAYTRENSSRRPCRTATRWNAWWTRIWPACAVSWTPRAPGAAAHRAGRRVPPGGRRMTPPAGKPQRTQPLAVTLLLAMLLVVGVAVGSTFYFSNLVVKREFERLPSGVREMIREQQAATLRGEVLTPRLRCRSCGPARPPTHIWTPSTAARTWAAW